MRIKDWNEFDERLKEVAIIDLACTEAGRTRDLAVIGAEADYKGATAARLAQRNVVVQELERFYRANRKQVEAGGKKSVELIFGRAGIRATAAKLKRLKGVKWEGVVAKIKELRADWREFVQAKESVKKDAVKRSMTPEEMAAVGVKSAGGEEFFFETFPEKIERTVLQ